MNEKIHFMNLPHADILTIQTCNCDSGMLYMKHLKNYQVLLQVQAVQIIVEALRNIMSFSVFNKPRFFCRHKCV